MVGKTFRRATPSSVFSDHWLEIVAALLWLVGGETVYKGVMCACLSMNIRCIDVNGMHAFVFRCDQVWRVVARECWF